MVRKDPMMDGRLAEDFLVRIEIPGIFSHS